MRKIAILTSGGDAPGMNACIRSVTRFALSQGLRVYGINRGYAGLIEGDITELDKRSVSNTIHTGGTFLQTDRCPEFLEPEYRKAGANLLRKRGIEGLVCIGGDGTFRGAMALCKENDIKVVCIPATIDRDLGYTENTIGFDTAVNNCLWAINSLRDTMQSHNRVTVLEVMGRNCGDIALAAGLAGGAEHIIVPEVEADIDGICHNLVASDNAGKRSNMVIVAEGAGKALKIAKEIEEKTQLEARTTVLGHIQRGGSPTYFDRIIACKMGIHAVELLQEGQKNRAIGVKGEDIFDMDLEEALSMKRKFNEKLYHDAHKMG
ncbi:MAG: 6-phosphofructokinase [Clostridia bacterium]|nr:6-phosphofructokinase [Clostridia bacterium]